MLVQYKLKMAEGTAVTLSSTREYFDRVNILVRNLESGVHPYITGIRGVVSLLDKERLGQRDLNNFGAELHAGILTDFEEISTRMEYIETIKPHVFGGCISHLYLQPHHQLIIRSWKIREILYVQHCGLD